MTRLPVVLAAVVLLAACGVNPPRPEAGSGRQSIADWTPSEPPPIWTLRGRTAIRVPDDSATLSVYWRQQPDHYRLDLRGPLGSGAVRLSGAPGAVILRTSDGDRYTAGTARELLRRTTGFDLPVSRLAWWVRGQPAPELGGTVELDADGRPVELVQSGWTVRYDRWSVISGYTLPGRLSVERDDIRLRLAVSEWNVPD